MRPLLTQNSPNPFPTGTRIAWELPRASRVSLRVFDITGREVAVLVQGTLTAGAHEVTFERGHLPSGIYFYRLHAGTFQATRRLVLID